MLLNYDDPRVFHAFILRHIPFLEELRLWMMKSNFCAENQLNSTVIFLPILFDDFVSYSTSKTRQDRLKLKKLEVLRLCPQMASKKFQEKVTVQKLSEKRTSNSENAFLSLKTKKSKSEK